MSWGAPRPTPQPAPYNARRDRATQDGAAYLASDVSSEVIGQVLEHIIADNGLLPHQIHLRFPLVVRCAKTGDGRTVRFIRNFSEHDQSVVKLGTAASSLLDP